MTRHVAGRWLSSWQLLVQVDGHGVVRLLNAELESEAKLLTPLPGYDSDYIALVVPYYYYS